VAGLASAFAGLAVALATQISSGMYDVRALLLVTLAAAAGLLAAFDASPEARTLWIKVVLGAGVAVGLLFHVFGDPTFYGERARLAGFRWLAATALVVLSAYLCIHLRASLVRARFLLLLGCFVAMGIAVVLASPRPWVDVWVLQQGAADALLHGVNPYAASYPDIYGRLSSQMYSPEVAHGGRVFGFPYPPLSLLAATPGFALFGDVRFAWVIAMAGGAWMIARAIGGSSGELAGLFMLFQPRTFFVLEASWTEAVVVAVFAFALLACARQWRPEWCGVALGLLLASKQYALFITVPLFFLVPRGTRLRAAVVALAAAAAVTAPFWLWDREALFRSLVRFHLLQPFRADSLSLLAGWARLGPIPGPAGFMSPAFGLGVLMVWTAVYARRSVFVAQAIAAGALAWIAVVLFSKQGFCNYYWLCAALFCAAAAAKAERLGEAT
jgi:hypothetical protein